MTPWRSCSPAWRVEDEGATAGGHQAAQIDRVHALRRGAYVPPRGGVHGVQGGEEEQRGAANTEQAEQEEGQTVECSGEQVQGVCEHVKGWDTDEVEQGHGYSHIGAQKPHRSAECDHQANRD
eukprot:CAMPEP_0173267204 /NCGR_PEP_ID=MMETSP1142-20121109/29633_1 /TAXON_ID=483371 /ORGANISM="non described non described, Strain CCMP2298" /LENGTH=122 /DNA_ID=CAMNT_0014203293 /DNA_START=693 /DNA_END=1062 /DNA_ORIENTATION=+